LSSAENYQTTIEENHVSHKKARFPAQGQRFGWQGHGNAKTMDFKTKAKRFGLSAKA